MASLLAKLSAGMTAAAIVASANGQRQVDAFLGSQKQGAEASATPRLLDDHDDALPEIEFVGKAPKFRIFPAGKKDANSTWLMISIGKIQEIDASTGKAVNSHAINSLAAEKTSFVEGTTEMSGVDVKTVTMTVPLPFTSADCSKGGGGGGSGGEAITGNITVKTFLYEADAEVPYEDYVVSLKKGQIKFNIEAEKWPFCDPSNTLSLEMSVKTPSDDGGPAPKKEKGMDQTAGGTSADGKKTPKGQRFTADAGGGQGVTMDLPEVVVVDDVAAAAGVELIDRGGKSLITFVFPSFKDRMVYDPAVGFDADGKDPGAGRRTSPVQALLAAFLTGLLSLLLQ